MGTTIRGLRRDQLTHGIVQISLDLASVEDALRLAAIAVEAGADWLEAGTPLLVSEGRRAVRALRKEFPDHPIVADLKMMDGGYGETSLYADAGADAVVVMGRSHDATIERAAEAAEAGGLLLMGDDMVATDRPAEGARLESLGVGLVIHHVGHDHRTRHRAEKLSPLTDLPAIVAATTVPVQAVGGLSVEEAIGCPSLGAGVVVFGAPLVIDDERSFAISEGDLPGVLSAAITRVHAAEVVYP
jgi:3-hexulose-6-phosphate synthase/6-phospho-3-hexuloisomerase